MSEENTTEARATEYHERWRVANDPEKLRAAQASGLFAFLALIQKSAGQLWQLLQGADFTQFPALLAAVAAFKAIESDPRSAAGIKDRVRAILGIMLAWAGLTPGTKDDTLITAVRDWLNNRPQVVDFLADVIAKLIAAADPVPTLQAVSNHCLAAHQGLPDSGAVSAALPTGINWPTIIQAVWTIWQIFHPTPAPVGAPADPAAETA